MPACPCQCCPLKRRPANSSSPPHTHKIILEGGEEKTHCRRRGGSSRAQEDPAELRSFAQWAAQLKPFSKEQGEVKDVLAAHPGPLGWPLPVEWSHCAMKSGRITSPCFCLLNFVSLENSPTCSAGHSFLLQLENVHWELHFSALHRQPLKWCGETKTTEESSGQNTEWKENWINRWKNSDVQQKPFGLNQPSDCSWSFTPAPF